MASGDGCSIKIGSTGTVGSLMSRELESVKHIRPVGDPPCLKHQSAPVSVPCGATPRRMQLRRFPSSEAGSSSGGVDADDGEGVITGRILESKKSRQVPRRNGNGCGAPILTPDRASQDGKKDKAGKTSHSFFVEVVDIKCNNPMSGRLKKLGFSKLSESIA